MARRSARIKQRSTTPAEASSAHEDSWVTASPASEELPVLPELPDLPEPGARAAEKPAMGQRQPASKLPQAASTPMKHKSSKQLLSAVAARTPKDRTPIKPAGEDMHPALHHPSTARPLDEARWLGFQALGANTAPPKAAGTGADIRTPSKTPVPATKNQVLEASPDFKFRFKSPFSSLTKASKQDSALSPTTRKLLDAGEPADAKKNGRSIFAATGFTSKADVTNKADASPQRKKVEPKGKMARFSDVHMAQFKKMDSIANHASAFRAEPSRFKPVVGQPLKKSPSKPDLMKPETNKLKRTQSKMDITEPGLAAPGSLKRTQSKANIADTSSKIPPTPLKRTQSKLDLTGSGLPRVQSTVRLVPSNQDVRPVSRHGPIDDNSTAKRLKRSEVDDAATTRPVSRDGKALAPPPVTSTPGRKITSQTALPRLAGMASRLMTPTRASAARSQSAKVNKTNSIMPPPMLKSPPTSSVFSPTNIAQSMRESARESMRKASQNLQRVRSILRTPNRKFSEDPAQVAAGTHMSPPPASTFEKALPAIPATAPVKKHVNFTSSTLQRATEEELTKSPSPMKLRAGSEMPSGAVIYPTLQTVQYPELGKEAASPTASPSRRLTFGGEAANHPRSFSFESNKAINFGPPSTGTIRMVRKSDASSLHDGKKRKLGSVQETSDKENDTPLEDSRSAKKIKATPATPSKTPASASKLPRRTPARGSAISKSRLAFLATPKRSKA